MPRDLACCYTGCLLFTEGMVTQMEQKAAIGAKGGIMDRTKSRITLDEPEEQIQNSMASNPLSYATIIALPSLLDHLPHGCMVVPIWHTMAETAKFGRNGPHS